MFTKKTRTQNIDIWMNDGYFMTMTRFWADMLKILKSRNSGQIFRFRPDLHG